MIVRCALVVLHQKSMLLERIGWEVFLKIHYIYMEGYLAIFMIYAYSVFRCSLFFGFVGCSWVDRSLACTHIYPLRNLSTSV
jgi:hypothetical protein